MAVAVVSGVGRIRLWPMVVPVATRCHPSTVRASTKKAPTRCPSAIPSCRTTRSNVTAEGNCSVNVAGARSVRRPVRVGDASSAAEAGASDRLLDAVTVAPAERSVP